MATWRCEECDYAYDEAAGWDEYDIPPGTAWEDIPDDWWRCPECGARKRAFVLSEPLPART